MAVILRYVDTGHSGYLASAGAYRLVYCTTCAVPPALAVQVARWKPTRRTKPDKAATVWAKHVAAVKT